MGKPDALSQWADHGSGAKDNENIVLLTPDFFAIRALEGIELVGEERDVLKEIRREVDKGETEEVVAKAVKELSKTSAHSVRSAEWSQSNGLLYFHGKVYVPNSAELRRQIVSLC